MEIYGSAQGFIEYCDQRGYDVSPTTDTDDIEKALLVSSEWIDYTYGNSFIGRKTGGFTQERAWPRKNATVYTSDGAFTFPDMQIPTEVKSATYEATRRLLKDKTALIKDFTPAKYKRASVDGAVSVEFVQFLNASEMQTEIPIIDMILSGLIDPNSAANFSSYSGSVTRV